MVHEKQPDTELTPTPSLRKDESSSRLFFLFHPVCRAGRPSHAHAVKQSGMDACSANYDPVVSACSVTTGPGSRVPNWSALRNREGERKDQ